MQFASLLNKIRKELKLHLPPRVTQHFPLMTGCPVIVYWGLSGMTWPEYLQGYAGLGILQTLSSLIRAARAVRGEQMHLSIDGKETGEEGTV